MDTVDVNVPQAHYADAETSNGPSEAPLAHAMGAGEVSTAATRRTVIMAKRPGERSFGMTLEQHLNVAPTDFPRVSFVFPHSAAHRAGIQSGWGIEFINGVSAVGRTVSDVAAIFRNLTQVMLFVDTTMEVPKHAATIPSAVGVAAPAVPTAPTAPAMPQPVAPPQSAPQSRLPLGDESFASLVPPSLLGVSSALSSSPMDSIATTTEAATALVVATSSSVAQSHAVVADETRSQTSTVAKTTTTPAPTQAAPLPQTNQPSVASPASSNGLQNASLHPSRNAVPVISSASTSIKTSAPSAIPAAFTATMDLPVVQPEAPVRATTTPPVVAAVVTATSVALASSTTATPAPSPPVPTAPAPAPRPQSAPRAALPVRIAHESVFTLPAVTPPPTVATTPTSSAASSNPAPLSGTSSAAASAAPAPAEPSTAAGKRRRRSTAAEPAPPAAPKRKRGRPPKKRATDGWDSEDAVFFNGSDDDVQFVESPPPSASGSRRSSRQSESGGRNRRSLTVDRLMNMGFEEHDAQASVEACGHDPDKCMLWIVSHLEEKQFLNDLNKASIESEQQKRLDAQEQKKQESETLRQATAFTSLFPTSYILSSSAEATRLNEMLSSTIGGIAADTLMRTLVTKLLTVEGKAIRWYKEAAKCYMLQLAERLETAFTAHDVVTCCSRTMATEPATNACAFVRALHEEEQSLTKALFSMPENHGGVPLEFLRADESMQFSLDDDGFEVVDTPQAPSSPSHD